MIYTQIQNCTWKYGVFKWIQILKLFANACDEVEISLWLYAQSSDLRFYTSNRIIK